MRRRDQTGITLIELAVVLALITILALVIYPIMGNILQIISAKGASEEIAGAIRFARQRAITKGNNHCIQFGPAGANNVFTVYDTGSANTCTTTTTVDGPTIITQGLTVLSPDNKALVFSAIGGNINSSGGYVANVLCVAADATAFRVRIDVTQYGGVRVKADDPSCSGS